MAKPLKIKAVLEAIDKFSGPIRRAASVIRTKLAAATARFDRLAKRAASSVGALASKLGILGGLSVGGLAVLVKNQAELGDQIAKNARRAGVGTDAYQELAHAFDLAGVSSEEWGKGLEKFNRTFGELQAGQGALHSLLKRTSPEFLKTLKSADGTEDALNKMLEAMGAIEDPARRSALAAAAFGRSGARMTLIMEGGAEGLAKARQELHDLGGVIDGETLTASEAFIDGMARLKRATGGVSNAIASALLPKLQPLLDRAAEWVKANREIIAQRVDAFVTRIGEALRSVDWDRVTEAGKKFARVVRRVWVALGGIEGIAEKLGILFATRFAVAVGQTAVSAFGLLALAAGKLKAAFVLLRAVVIAHPVLALVSALALAAVLLIDNWEPIKAWFQALWDRIAGAFRRGVEWVKGVLAPFEALGPKISGVWNEATSLLSDVWDSVSESWVEAMGMLGELLRDIAPDWLIEAWEALPAVFAGIWEGIKGAFKAGIDAITGWLDGLLDSVSSVIGSLREALEFVGVLDRDSKSYPTPPQRGLAGAGAGGGGGAAAGLAGDFGGLAAAAAAMRAASTGRSQAEITVNLKGNTDAAEVSAPRTSGDGPSVKLRVGRPAAGTGAL